MEKTNTGKYHVTKHPSGWQVVLGGGKKAIKTFPTQKEALEYAESLAESRNSTVYLHGRKGYIRDAVSFKEEPKKVEKQKQASAAKAKPTSKNAKPIAKTPAKKPVAKADAKKETIKSTKAPAKKDTKKKK